MRHEMRWSEPSFAGVIGVARADITPPEGIYARNWGAATHDTASGVHRPLTATALTLQATVNDLPLVLISADLGWWRDPDDEAFVRGGIAESLGLPQTHVLLCLTHTHAGPSLHLGDGDCAGGNFVAPYREHLRQTLAGLAQSATAVAIPATLATGTGGCALATNRDLSDPVRPERFLTGFDPGAVGSDTTLLVGRVTDAVTGAVLATIVNYACHPTTLGHTNRQISPDYVGAMRETVENATNHAPCLFLQGASGELAPREQYGADTEISDAHGRALGYAVLSTLATMLPANTGLRYTGMVSSGAPLALWERETIVAPSVPCLAEVVRATLALQPLASQEELERELRHAVAANAERLRRRLQVRRTVGDGDTVSYPVWVWQLGSVVLVAHPGEAYSLLQTVLRAALPQSAVFVVNVANGWYGYLPPHHLYGRDLYAAKQTPLAAGCLEAVIAAVLSQLCADGSKE